MTVAVVVMLMEAVSDLSVVSPLMLGISVARVVSGFINRHAYDEGLLILKGMALTPLFNSSFMQGIPYLEAEPPTQKLSEPWFHSSKTLT